MGGFDSPPEFRPVPESEWTRTAREMVAKARLTKAKAARREAQRLKVEHALWARARMYRARLALRDRATSK